MLHTVAKCFWARFAEEANALRPPGVQINLKSAHPSACPARVVGPLQDFSLRIPQRLPNSEFPARFNYLYRNL